MLEMIRKNSQSFVTKIIIALIAAVFIFWGGSANFGKSARRAAMVNGKEISLVQFDREYNDAVRFFQEGGGDTPKNFKEQVLNRLIFRELARQGAELLGLEVTDQAMQQHIATLLAMQSGKKQFEMEDYKRFLDAQRISLANFETRVRGELMIQQTVTLLEALTVVSQTEKEQLIDYLSQEVKVAWAVFKSEDHVPAETAEKDLQAWYDTRKQHYRSLPERKLQYLFFSKEAAAREAGITDETVARYYQENKERYLQPEERRARYILFAVENGVDNKVRAEKKARAEEVLAKIRTGADFVQMVRQYSEDPAAKMNDGDLGFLSRDKIMPELGEVIFSLQPGQVSQMVESPVGYLLLKLEEIRPEKQLTLDELRADIHKNLEQEAVGLLVADKALGAYEGIIKAGGLAQYATQNDAAIEQTELFRQDAPPDKHLEDPALLRTVFSLAKGELSSIVETADGSLIFWVEDSREPAVQELSVVHDQVLADFRREKSVELARAAAGQLLLELRDKKNWPASAPRKESAYLKQTRPSEELPGPMQEDIFRHLSVGALPQTALNQNNDFYVYQVVDIRKSAEELETKLQESLLAQLFYARKQELLTNWHAILFNQTAIWVNKDVLR